MDKVLDAMLQASLAHSVRMLKAENDQLRAELAEARAALDDSERYRWIRQSAAGTIRLDGDPTGGDRRWLLPMYVHWAGGPEALDAEIDRLRK